MQKHIIIISKDILIPDYLPPYGNKIFNTPNINVLAEKGTIFTNHYCSAPSTAMSVTSMFTGLYPYEMNRADYKEVKEADLDFNLFDEMFSLGYEPHLLWSKNYIYMAEKFSKCYGNNTIHHNSLKLNQSAGPNVPITKAGIVRNESKLNETYNKIIEEISTINCNKRIFLWIHLPHVLLGAESYGADMETFDKIIGFCRERFGDESIYLTADHGHMNMQKSKISYGFDLYQSAIKIPLITPRINSFRKIDKVTTNVDLSSLILTGDIKFREYVVLDTAYYAQPHRKFGIIKDEFKYIYNKYNKKEEVYDLEFDPNENNNLLERFLYDEDRKGLTDKRQVYFYNKYNELDEFIKFSREIKTNLWKKGSLYQELSRKINLKVIRLKQKVKRKLKKYEKKNE